MHLAGSNDNAPMNCVNWYEAYAFCIWDGGFLPTNAEYEYAEAGGSEQREYAWGSTDPGTGNQYAIFACQYPNTTWDGGGAPICPLGAGAIAPVGTASLGAARWGQLDLTGDVWEWTLDWAASYVDPSVDGAYLQPTMWRSLEGSAFSEMKGSLLATGGNSESPTMGSAGTAVRCARPP